MGNAIDKEFWSGGVMITRYDYESLPCPMCAEILDDSIMQKIADDTHGYLLDAGWTDQQISKYLGPHLDEVLDDDREGDQLRSEFWRYMEKSAIENGMAYYEDMPKDE
jgi:hypothetical protein